MAFKFKKMKPLDFIYLFGVCGTICTVLIIYFTWLHNRSSSDKSTRIETGVNKANEEVAELRKQNNYIIADWEIIPYETLWDIFVELAKK